jgi:hypothetical protein
LMWDKPQRDLQIFRITFKLWRLKDSVYFVKETLHLWCNFYDDNLIGWCVTLSTESKR